MANLAVVFPGVGYHCDKPLLYYGKKVAHSVGYDEIINLNYSYKVEGMRGNGKKMMEAYVALYAQAKEVLDQVDFTAYEHIVFLSKSIGTIIATNYAQNNGLMGNVKHVLYTPLAQTFTKDPVERLEETRAKDAFDAIAFIGSADPWSEVSFVASYAKQCEVELMIYEGLNHSLESGNVASDIDVMKMVMEATKNYLKA